LAAFHFPFYSSTVTIAMVTNRLRQIFKIMKDNFCEFTYDMSYLSQDILTFVLRHILG